MSPSWVRRNFGFIVTAAMNAVFMTCMVALAVFAQTDSLGELLVGRTAFGDWRVSTSRSGPF
jgi:hypothetical protein